MPTISRLTAASIILREPAENLIFQLHKNKVSPENIVNEIYKKTKIHINPRTIQKILKLPVTAGSPNTNNQNLLYKKPIGKGEVISIILNQPFNELLKNLYISQNMTAAEISDELFKKTKILITNRSIARNLKKLGLIRTLSEAFNLAIKTGRKSYVHLRRTKKSIELRKGVQLKMRYNVLQRDKFRCVLCGRDAKDDRLEIDHIVPVVAGGTNDIKNLRTLCAECNKGKMLLEERHIIAL